MISRSLSIILYYHKLTDMNLFNFIHMNLVNTFSSCFNTSENMGLS